MRLMLVGPPEISKLQILVAQIYLSDNSTGMGYSASVFWATKILGCLAFWPPH